ncbi:hypothetical protein BDP27DRAFT_1428849 [Rhodocollybia butyracea]|uniref:Uncharacterized protein n=1 Tax=Rhodocollybia butyracea TaxID=206335 RepID=A0A9P5PG92_9AGAR|nr:hypothetical protein BDP27DRAFT_1428849 [Rhodocollybia butyracea]
MDPHSLIENLHKKFFFNWRRPEMRSYDNLEYDTWNHNHHRLPESKLEAQEPIPVTLDEGDISGYYQDPDYFRVFQYFRFFDIIEGFLKGDLDLSGRHETRFNELKPIWESFFNDVFRIKDTVCILLVQEEDEDGFLRNQLFYKITKEDWKDFRLK